MSLTDAEKRAGRLFRDDCNAWLEALNETDRPDFEVPHFIGIYRHACPEKNNHTIAIELREQYVFSPISPVENVPAGRFGFLWREGRCRFCRQRARSRAGRLVDGHHRPPLDGRATRS